MQHHPTPPTIAVTRGRFGSTAGKVVEQVRACGPARREEIATATGLSVPTVGRTVTQLVAARVLRERPDLAPVGAIGRPSTPVEIDRDHYGVLGVHLGRRLTTVAVGDLSGRLVTHRTLPRHPAALPDLEAVARAASDLLGASGQRAPLSLGVVAPWRDVGVEEHATAAALAELTGLDVRSADHVAAIAATEFAHRRHGTPGATLYVYARDTIGFAVALDKGSAVEVSRVGSLTHFPTGADVRCPCGRTGCLEVTSGDRALLARARALGLGNGEDISALHRLAGPGSDGAGSGTGQAQQARELLAARAHDLGTVAASVRDIIAPDRVVLVGQAFTGYPPVLEHVLAGYATGSLREIPASFTRFATGIQAVSACTVALGPIDDDPFAVLPRTPQARRGSTGA